VRGRGGEGERVSIWPDKPDKSDKPDKPDKSDKPY
jgi:hypothetical protein